MSHLCTTRTLAQTRLTPAQSLLALHAPLGCSTPLHRLHRFAQRMRCVANDFIVNVRKEPTAVIRKYEQDIAELQQELAMHDSLTERHQISYGPYTDAQKAEVAAQVQAFLQSQEAPDSIAPLQLLSLRHMKEVLSAAKVGLHPLNPRFSSCLCMCPMSVHVLEYQAIHAAVHPLLGCLTVLSNHPPIDPFQPTCTQFCISPAQAGVGIALTLSKQQTLLRTDSTQRPAASVLDRPTVCFPQCAALSTSSFGYLGIC